MKMKSAIAIAFLFLVSSGLQAQITYPDSATVQVGTDELFWDFDTRKTDVSPDVTYGPDGGVNIYTQNDSVFMRFGAPEYTIIYKGATLNDLKGGGSYEVVSAGQSANNYPGSEDSNPGNFDFKIWPSANGDVGTNSFQGTDGNLYRVQYQEFWGWEIDSLVNNDICPDPNVVTTLEGGLEKCWYNGFVLTKSTDDGDTWALAGSAPADYVVASSPYKLQEQSNTTRHGVFPWNNADSFSKVFKVGSYYYFPVQFWTEGSRISTIMRTNDISDASSWRYWDGSDFTIENVNPYYDTVTDPESHLPPDIQDSGFLHINDAKATVEGMKYSSYFGKYIRTQIRAYSSNPEITPGVYFHLSDDGFNWSGPQLLYRFDYAPELNSGVELGGRSENFAYPVLVDKTDPGSSTLGQSVWMFYVTFNPANTGNPERDIRRVQVDFATHSVSGFTVTHTDLNLPEDASPGDGYCDNGYGRCSLITAINEANSRPPWVSASTELTIEFDNSLSGEITEDYASMVSKKIVIDGTTHSGYSANTKQPEAGWDATLPFEIVSGLNFQGSGHIIKGVHISSISVGSESDTAAVRITASRVDTLNLYGTSDTPSLIGGSTASEANLLASVHMLGSADTLRGNLIGMDGNGDAIVDPSAAFVTIQSSGNVVDANVMGNTDYRGINISNGDGNTISGNMIGFAPWNGSDKGTGGAAITVSTSDNVISGNTIGFTSGEAAIYIDGQSGNSIYGNYIGTNPNFEDYGNAVAGIWVAGSSSDNIIGKSDGTSPNVIANNTGAGIDFNVMQGSGNTVYANLIYDNDGGSIANYSHTDVADPPSVYSAFRNANEDSLYVYFTDTDSLTESETYRVEFFLASNTATEGQGNEYIGAWDVELHSTEMLGVSLPGGNDFSTYPNLSVTITGSEGNTSYYSDLRKVLNPSLTPVASFDVDSISTTHNDETRVEGTEVILYNTGNDSLDWFLDNEQIWAYAEPDHGTLAAGDSVTIGITLDSREITEPQVLSDVLYLKSNDVNNPSVGLAVEIDMSSVSAVPMITFGVDTLRFTYQKQPGDVTHNESFFVKNLGNSGLDWRLTKNQPWIGNMTPLNGTLSANDSTEVTMDLTVGGSIQTGTYQAIIVAFGSYGGGSETAFELFVIMEVTDGGPPPGVPMINITGNDSLTTIADSVEIHFEVENFIVGVNAESSNGVVNVQLNGENALTRNNTNSFFLKGLDIGQNMVVLELVQHDGNSVDAKDTVWVERKEMVVIPPSISISGADETVTLAAGVDSVEVEYSVESFILGPDDGSSNGYLKVFLNDEELLQRMNGDPFFVHNLQDGMNTIVLQLFKHNDEAVVGASDTLYVETLLGTGIEDEDGIPDEYQLSQNYPNPFNPATNIQFDLPVNATVKLTVYDALGRQIATLVDGFMKAGRHQVQFDASGLSSGMYLYRIETEGFTKTQKMALIK